MQLQHKGARVDAAGSPSSAADADDGCVITGTTGTHPLIDFAHAAKQIIVEAKAGSAGALVVFAAIVALLISYLNLPPGLHYHESIGFATVRSGWMNVFLAS